MTSRRPVRYCAALVPATGHPCWADPDRFITARIDVGTPARDDGATYRTKFGACCDEHEAIVRAQIETATVDYVDVTAAEFIDDDRPTNLYGFGDSPMGE